MIKELILDDDGDIHRSHKGTAATAAAATDLMIAGIDERFHLSASAIGRLQVCDAMQARLVHAHPLGLGRHQLGHGVAQPKHDMLCVSFIVCSLDGVVVEIAVVGRGGDGGRCTLMHEKCVQVGE